MAKLGVIVVGAGDMGSKHARHWQGAGAKVLAVCDPDLGRAQQSGSLVAAEATEHYLEWLEDERVQLVSICTPTFLHAELGLAALAAGKHVLCEKPIALSLAEAKQMKEMAERQDCQLRIGLMRRFDPATKKLQEWLEPLGNPVYVSAQIPAGIRPKQAMHDKRANGGPIIDMLCHHFDVWSRLFGAYPRLAYARGACFAQDKTELAHIHDKAIDTAVVVLEFPGGHVASIHISWGLPSGVPITEHHVYTAPGGLIKLDWDNENNRLELYKGKFKSVWQEPVDAWKVEIEQFYQELVYDAPKRLASADEAIRALELSLEILEQIEQSLEQEPI